VLTQVVVYLNALTAQFGIQHLGDERDAAAAARAGTGFRFQRRNRMAAALYRFNDVAFADIKAGAYLRAIRQGVDPG